MPSSRNTKKSVRLAVSRFARCTSIYLVIFITVAAEIDVDARLAHKPLHTYTKPFCTAIAHGFVLLYCELGETKLMLKCDNCFVVLSGPN